jgi:hypothetical protein
MPIYTPTLVHAVKVELNALFNFLPTGGAEGDGKGDLDGNFLLYRRAQ